MCTYIFLLKAHLHLTGLCAGLGLLRTAESSEALKCEKMRLVKTRWEMIRCSTGESWSSSTHSAQMSFLWAHEMFRSVLKLISYEQHVWRAVSRWWTYIQTGRRYIFYLGHVFGLSSGSWGHRISRMPRRTFLQIWHKCPPGLKMNWLSKVKG